MTIQLHSELYPLDAVRAAATAFAAHAAIVVETVGAYHRVSIRATDPSQDERLARELANYALVTTAVARSAAAP
jgi:hypothetical protein